METAGGLNAKYLKTGEYRLWKGMIHRCHNTNAPNYPQYGGRGICVCERWRNSLEAFLADMGERPSMEHSLDRYPDQNGNYEPGNVRWATHQQQQRNIRSNVNLTLNGETLCLSEWAARTGINDSTIADRLRKGWTTEQALTTPPRTFNRCRPRS